MFRNFNAILDAIPISFIITDDTGHIVYLNRATEKLTSYCLEDLKDQNISSIIPRPYKENHDNNIEMFNKGQGKKLMHSSRFLPILKANGQQVIVELYLSEFTDREEKFFLGMMYDQEHQKKFLEMVNHCYQHHINNALQVAIGNVNRIKNKNKNIPELEKIQKAHHDIKSVLEQLEQQCTSQDQFFAFINETISLNITRSNHE